MLLSLFILILLTSVSEALLLTIFPLNKSLTSLLVSILSFSFSVGLIELLLIKSLLLIKLVLFSFWVPGALILSFILGNSTEFFSEFGIIILFLLSLKSSS